MSVIRMTQVGRARTRLLYCKSARRFRNRSVAMEWELVRSEAKRNVVTGKRIIWQKDGQRTERRTCCYILSL